MWYIKVLIWWSPVRPTCKVRKALGLIGTAFGRNPEVTIWTITHLATCQGSISGASWGVLSGTPNHSTNVATLKIISVFVFYVFMFFLQANTTFNIYKYLPMESIYIYTCMYDIHVNTCIWILRAGFSTLEIWLTRDSVVSKYGCCDLMTAFQASKNKQPKTPQSMRPNSGMPKLCFCWCAFLHVVG